MYVNNVLIDNFPLILNTIIALAAIVMSYFIFISSKKHDKRMYFINKQNIKVDSIMNFISEVVQSADIFDKDFDNDLATISQRRFMKLIDNIAILQNQFVLAGFINEYKDEFTTLTGHLQKALVSKEKLNIEQANLINLKSADMITDIIRKLNNYLDQIDKE